MAFDGISGFCQGVKPSTSAAFTCIAWFNYTTLAGYLIAENVAGGFGIQPGNTGKIYVLQVDLAVEITSVANWTTNTTYMVAVTAATVGGALSLYINGALDSSITNPGFTQNGNFNCGRNRSAGTANFSTGRVDEIAWFNYALTGTQIANLYAAR